MVMDHTQPSNDECSKVCLGMIVEYFIRVKGYSHTNDIWKRYLEKQKGGKQKSLRKARWEKRNGEERQIKISSC